MKTDWGCQNNFIFELSFLMLILHQLGFYNFFFLVSEFVPLKYDAEIFVTHYLNILKQF